MELNNMIKKLLKEATAAGATQAADRGQRVTINSKDVKLVDLLNELLAVNLDTFEINCALMDQGELPDKNFINLLIIGIGGTGKTSMLEQ